MEEKKLEIYNQHNLKNKIQLQPTTQVFEVNNKNE